MKKTNILTLMLILTVSVAFGQSPGWTPSYSLNYPKIKVGNLSTGEHQMNGLFYFLNGINVPLRSLSDSTDNAASTKFVKQLVQGLGSPLTGGSGSYVKDGKINLGLDLSTINTDQKGLLTSDLYLYRGNVLSGNNQNIEITDSYVSIGKQVNSSIQAIQFNDFGGNVMQVVDALNSKGLEYQSDYSANFTARSLVDKEYVDSVVNAGGSIPTGTDKQVLGYSSGTPTPVTLGLTQFSDVSGIPAFSNGVYAFTGINPTTGSAFRSFIEFSTTTPKAGTFPTYGTAGVLPVSNGVASGDAVNVGQLNSYELLSNKSTTLTSPNNTTYPTTLAVSNALTPVSAANVSNQSQTNWLGDSFFDYSNSWISPVNQFKTLTGFKANNLGVTGTTTTQFKARFDALVAANPSYLQQSWVFGSFRNDITQGGYNTGTANTIKSNYAAMVASLGHTRFLIYQMIPNNSETTGSAGRTWLNQINADLAALYPNNYVPTIAALQAAGNGSTSDNNAIAQGLIPPSLQFDTNHLNTAGYLVFAQQGVNKKPQLQPDGDKLLTLNSAGGIFQQGQQYWDLGTGGEYRIGGFPAIKIPDQNTTQFYNTIVVGNGGKALSHTNSTQGQGNTLIGMQTADKTTVGFGNTAIGNYALYNNVSGNNSTAVGESAGLNSTGNAGVFLGKDAGRNITSGSNNAALTPGSGLGISTGGSNISIGFNSIFASNGSNNIGVGVSAFQNNTGASSHNVALGGEALKGGTGVVSSSIGIGRQTGLINNGSNNIFIGDQAARLNTTGAKGIVIAYQGELPSATASNQMNIGNLLWGKNMNATGTATAGLLGVNTIDPQVALDVTGGARVSVAPTTSTDVVRLQEISAGQNIGANAATATAPANASSFKTALATSLQDVVNVNRVITKGAGVPSIQGTDDLFFDAGAGGDLGLNFYSTSNTIINRLGGNVGIGASNPAAKLEVNGSARASSNDGNANTLVRNVDVSKQSRYTASGNGSSTAITVAHGLSGITSTSSVVVFANSSAATGITYATIDATNVTINYTVAPVSGTNNLIYTISIK